MLERIINKLELTESDLERISKSGVESVIKMTIKNMKHCTHIDREEYEKDLQGYYELLKLAKE